MCSSNATSPAECLAVAPPETPICYSDFRAAGVRCIQSNNFIHFLSFKILCLLDHADVTLPTVTPPPGCNEFDLRLTNTFSYFQDSNLVYEGNVEMCINGTYVAICDLGWDDVEAQLACNIAGYSAPFFRKFCCSCQEVME